MSRSAIALALAVVLVAAVVIGTGAYVPGASPNAVEDPRPEAVLSSPTAEPTATIRPTSTATALPTATATVTATASARPTATVAPGASAKEALYREIVTQYLGNLPGTFGVAIKDLKTGETVLINPDRPFPAASLYKLSLTYEVLREAKAGNFSLKTLMDITEADMAEAEFDEKLVPGMSVTIDRGLWFLITLSSNSASAALQHYVNWADMNEGMRELGLVNTRMAGDPTEQKYGDWRDELASTIPREMLRSFETLYHQQLLDQASSEEMMYLLRHQQIDDRLSYNLPEGVVMAHKTGNLSGTINDAGIIFGPETDLYVGVLSQGADYEQTTQALRDLGRALYDAANE